MEKSLNNYSHSHRSLKDINDISKNSEDNDLRSN